jgi:hypothetical protein
MGELTVLVTGLLAGVGLGYVGLTWWDLRRLDEATGRLVAWLRAHDGYVEPLKGGERHVS